MEAWVRTEAVGGRLHVIGKKHDNAYCSDHCREPNQHFS